MSRSIARLALAALLSLSGTAAALAGAMVPFDGGFGAGTIVIRTGERRLYYVTGEGSAVRYPVAVGRAGKQWAGAVYVNGKHVRPAWSPPWEVRRDNPRLPHVIPGGAANNPMGAAALTLSGGGEYAIHGTNRRARSATSQATAASACTTRTSST